MNNLSSTTGRPARTIIYDMDGLLVDSEPLWREAEIAAFAAVGVSLTEDNCKETMGWRTNEVVRYWFQKRPWTGKSLDELELDLLDRVEALIRQKGEPLPGVHDSIAMFQQHGLRIGLASSSPMRLINAVLDKFGIAEHFEVVHSAEFEPLGKPHPAVFLTAAEKLGATAQDCLVLEDSFYGLIAAKAAKMKVVGVPDDEGKADPRFCIADVLLNSLDELTYATVQSMFDS